MAPPGRAGETHTIKKPELCFSMGSPSEKRTGPSSASVTLKPFPERKAKPFRNKPPNCPSACGDGARVFPQTLLGPLLRDSPTVLTRDSFLVPGGVLGAVFNALNYWLTMFRIR